MRRNGQDAKSAAEFAIKCLKFKVRINLEKIPYSLLMKTFVTMEKST